MPEDDPDALALVPVGFRPGGAPGGAPPPGGALGVPPRPGGAPPPGGALGVPRRPGGRQRVDAGVGPDGQSADAGAQTQPKQPSLETRLKLASILMNSPSILKLIEKRVLKWSDMLTDDAIDFVKIARVRRFLEEQVETSSESFKAAQLSKGYASLSQPATVKGLNTTIGGLRNIPGSKYVIYTPPRYADE